MRPLTLLTLLAACKPEPGAADPDLPTVIASSPADGAVDVDVDASVRISFDRAIDPALLDADHVVIVPDVPGALRWDEPSLTATFDPTGPLAVHTPYTVTLTPDLAVATTLRFSTGGPPEVAPPDATVAFDGDRVTVSVDGDALRTYTLASTHPQRDGGPSTRTFTEPDGQPRLRSGDVLFDALFALAVHEAGEASVDQIHDGGFANGAGTPCRCYETGERWTYVWTRDTSYAAWLGLWLLDPARARDSLLFKLSAPKGGGGEQIVQDTGSGGSWPVSTDRVVWALAAREVEKALPDPARVAFRERAFAALANTLEHDRDRVWDPADGLYRGEQSFLDWREQSYPPWTAANVTPIAESRSLSTNAAHHALLTTAAAWAREAGDPRAATWAAWADDLGRAMRDAFWRGGDPIPLVGLRMSPFDPSSLPRGDHLGVALAILEGVVSPEQGAQALSAWPHTPYGPPVIWPQQPDTPIYHNRSIWPFVTSFAAIAAARVGDGAVFDHDLSSLARGAALNLSNMENLEFLTGRNWVDAGAESGPVVNSRRQLWSVGGYLGVVTRGLFGVQLESDGISLQPFLTPDTHRAWLAGSTEVSLRDLTWQGRTLDLFLHLPAPGAAGGRPYVVSQVALDGAALGDGRVPTARIASGSRIDVTLTDPGGASGSTVRVDADDGDFRRFWPPQAPAAPTLRREAGGLQITWPAAADPALRWDVWRDGARIADNLTAGTWSDGPDVSAVSPCYVITATWAATGLVSQPSPPTCWWGEAGERLEDHDAWSLRQISGDGAWSEQHGQPHFMDWGDPGDALELPALRPRWSGTYRLQLVYGNGAGPINTGVTCAVKRLTVVDDRDVVVHAATIAMPQLADWSRWEASTSTDVALDAGVTYRVQIEDDDNMSAFAHFTSYTGGLGGGPSTYNRANIHALRVMALDGDLGAPLPAPGVSLDGTNDIDAYPPEARRDAGDLGAAMETWDAFAVDHDDDNLYVTLVSPAFEQDYAPWMIYLEALDDPDAPATPGEGMAYSYGSQTDAAALPFRPTHVIALRAAGGVGPDGGPWPGVYRLERGAWTQIRRLGPGADLLLAADRHTLSARVSRHLLGDPRAVRLVAHVLWGAPGAEWKDLVPADHAPWSGDGGSLTLDFTAPRAAPGGP